MAKKNIGIIMTIMQIAATSDITPIAILIEPAFPAKEKMPATFGTRYEIERPSI